MTNSLFMLGLELDRFLESLSSELKKHGRNKEVDELRSLCCGGVCYVPVEDLSEKNNLEACLMAAGLKVDRGFQKQTVYKYAVAVRVGDAS